MRRLMATLWRWEFAWNLSRHAGMRITPRRLRAQVAHLPAAAMPGDDAAKRFNLTLAQSLHAAVRLLEREAGVPSPEARRIAGRAFGQSGSWLARGAVRLWLRLERDPLAGVLKRGAAPLAAAMWGNGMVLEDRRGPGDTLSLCVLSCPFHDYFWNAGRSDLTPILCAWDTAWQDAVNASDKPLRVDIRTTLARGDAACEFAFRRAAKPPEGTAP